MRCCEYPIVAQARHCYVAIEDPEIEGRFLFVRAKNNLGARKRQALAYGLSVKTIQIDETGGIDAPFIQWDFRPVEGRAADLIGEALGSSSAGRPSKMAFFPVPFPLAIFDCAYRMIAT